MAEVLPKDEFEVLPPGEFIYLIHICAFVCLLFVERPKCS